MFFEKLHLRFLLGKDAEHVSQERQRLAENWDDLRKVAVKRKSDLEGLAAIHDWLNSARDLEAWSESTLTILSNPPSEKVSVDVLIQNNDDIKNEINTRNSDFEKLIGESRNLSDGDTAVGKSVADQTQRLRDLQKRLQYDWDERRNLLEKMSLAQKFLRDLDQLDALTVAQETYLQVLYPLNQNRQVSKITRRRATRDAFPGGLFVTSQATFLSGVLP